MAIKRLGKVGLEWQKTRRAWLKANPADYKDSWPCGICTLPVYKGQMDLDHVIRKGGHAELRNELDNLRPVHRSCHIKKDSGMRY